MEELRLGDDVNEQLRSDLGNLVTSFELLATDLKDERIRKVEREIVEPVLESGQQLRSVFSEIVSFIQEARKEIVELGFADFQYSQQEIDSRVSQAEVEWRAASGPIRTRFGLDVGKFSHEQYQKKIIEFETNAGRERNVDFGIEYFLRHPDGGKVWLDYVDLIEHVIIDYKSARLGESEVTVANRSKNRKQRQRHIEAYSSKYGVVPNYRYETYDSTADLYP